MRDWQTEGPPKQSDDREPVGARADHRRLGESPHIGYPNLIAFYNGRQDEYDRHSHKKQRGYGAHSLQFGKAIFRFPPSRQTAPSRLEHRVALFSAYSPVR